MSAAEQSFYQKKLRQMGRWMFARYCRNRNVPFEHAYYIIFNRQPRFI